MAPRRIYWAILTGLLLATLPACQKGRTEQEGDVKELTVIFATTTGLAGDGYNEPLMRSIMESVALAVLGDVLGDVVITTETN